MGLVYYGITMNTGNMGGDPFINFVISGSVDLVSGMVALLILKKFGRYVYLNISFTFPLVLQIKLDIYLCFP